MLRETCLAKAAGMRGHTCVWKDRERGDRGTKVKESWGGVTFGDGGDQGCSLTELAKPPSAFALPAWNFLPPSQKVKVGGRLEQPFLGSVHGSHNHTFWVSKVLKTEVSLHHIFLSFSIFLMKLK